MDERKHRLLKQIANLIEDYENCECCLACEIWFDEGKERHIYNGESFAQIRPKTKKTIINSIPYEEIERDNLRNVLRGELTRG